MQVKHLSWPAIEKFRTVNNLNPYYTKEIFSKNTNLTQRFLVIKLKQKNNTKNGINTLRSLGPHILNFLPSKMKKETEYNGVSWFYLLYPF